MLTPNANYKSHLASLRLKSIHRSILVDHRIRSQNTHGVFMYVEVTNTLTNKKWFYLSSCNDAFLHKYTYRGYMKVIGTEKSLHYKGSPSRLG